MTLFLFLLPWPFFVFLNLIFFKKRELEFVYNNHESISNEDPRHLSHPRGSERDFP
jgi:hypothetical protein